VLVCMAALVKEDRLPISWDYFLDFRNIETDANGKISGDKAEAMIIFYEELLPCCIGPKIWCPKEFVRDLISEGGIVTASDEAFIGVCLLNYAEGWISNNKKARYTNHRQGNQEYGGWDAEGLRAYNRLFDKVEQSRQKPSARVAEIYFRSRMIAKWGPTGTKKKNRNGTGDKEPIVVTRSEWNMVAESDNGYQRGRRTLPTNEITVDDRMSRKTCETSLTTPGAYARTSLEDEILDIPANKRSAV
jgi:hypothetical protein